MYEEENEANHSKLQQEAIDKMWNFLEERGFILEKLVEKDVSFILGTPDGGAAALELTICFGKSARLPPKANPLSCIFRRLS